MAVDRGTRKEKLLYYIERCAILGTLGGIGLGVYSNFDGATPDMVKGAIEFGLPGFIIGTVAGVVLGLLAIIWDSIFKR
jgi:hypothetical protein